MAVELICFSLLGIAALLLNAGLSFQALPIFWLVLPFLIKISLMASAQKLYPRNPMSCQANSQELPKRER